eukprot:365361-Chlamydomonas_euryale.AAC.1
MHDPTALRAHNQGGPSAAKSVAETRMRMPCQQRLPMRGKGEQGCLGSDFGCVRECRGASKGVQGCFKGSAGVLQTECRGASKGVQGCFKRCAGVLGGLCLNKGRIAIDSAAHDRLRCIWLIGGGRERSVEQWEMHPWVGPRDMEPGYEDSKKGGGCDLAWRITAQP